MMTFNISSYVRPNILIIRTDDLTIPTVQQMVQQLQQTLATVETREAYLVFDMQTAPLDFAGTLGLINFLNKVERQCAHELNLYLIGHHAMMATLHTMLVKNRLVEENHVFRIDNLGNALDVIRRQLIS